MVKIDQEFSKKQVTKAGDILRDSSASDADKQWVSKVLGFWRAKHYYPINTFQSTLRDKLKAINSKALVAQRLKRSPSIVSKIKRFPGMKLSRMQDIVGLMAVLQDMKKVEDLSTNYQDSKFSHELVGTKDYIKIPKDSGYRGIHFIYKYNNKRAAQYNGLHIELQIRTELQHAWATAVETMGIFLESALKSSEWPEEWLKFFSLTGSAFALYEGCNPVPGYDKSEAETYERVIEEATRLNVIDTLKSFTVATGSIKNDKQKGGYHIVILKFQEKMVEIESFGKKRFSAASERYSQLEKDIEKGGEIQVVLVATSSIDLLSQAYPNYFLDTKKFISNIDLLRKKVESDHKRKLNDA